MLSIPASKAFEVGSGSIDYEVSGSIHNGPFIVEELDSTTHLTITTYNSGGIHGGIRNAALFYFKAGLKPPATIGQALQTTTNDGGMNGVLEAEGRYDPRVLLRA